MLLWELLCRVSALLRVLHVHKLYVPVSSQKSKILHKCNQQAVCSTHAQEECYSTFPRYCNHVQKAAVDFWPIRLDWQCTRNAQRALASNWSAQPVHDPYAHEVAQSLCVDKATVSRMLSLFHMTGSWKKKPYPKDKALLFLSSSSSLI